jgi:aminoglycoside phosphotransferase family enzyme/predicted kinase
VERVDVVQTHISVVFLAGAFVYKVKKPVQLGFLDFSSLQKRHHFCEEEVRLNRRLALDVYLGVVPVTRGPSGLRFESEGETIEWAVKMRRLPDDATLQRRLLRGEIRPEQIDALAFRLAEFHRCAERSPHIASFGAFEVVAGNMRENFEQTREHVGETVSRPVWNRLRERTEELLDALRPTIEARAARSVPCDTHGDLRLDHVYLFPERSPPDDLVIIDCIEFNERFRYADPVADMAFLAMDLRYHGRPDLARGLARRYFEAAHDADGASLLPLYSAYRAVVRAKVEGIAYREQEIPWEKRLRHLNEARKHWLLALGEIETPSRRPCLVLIGGLPGSGKSTLAHGLASTGGWRLLRSDVVRKELAGLPLQQRARDEHYGDAWSQRTYAALLERAEASLTCGERVLVDANFRKNAQRRPFVEMARRLAVPLWFLVCSTPPATARERLARRRGDASDADPAIYDRVAREWETPDPDLVAMCINIDGTAPSDFLRDRVLAVLRDAGFAAFDGPPP